MIVIPVPWLPEMTLRSEASGPPTVLFSDFVMRTPSSELPSAPDPLARVPTRLPTIVLPGASKTWTPRSPLPETTLRSTVVFADAPPDGTTLVSRTPFSALPRSPEPSAVVPM